MNTKGFKTYLAKPGEVQRKWYIVDATNKPLGRLATQIAKVLQGKHKPTYTPHIDVGDGVIIINAEKVYLSGKKREQKTYVFYSGYPSGNKDVPFKVLIEKNPEKVFQLAVKRMLPRNKLRDKRLKRLKVYAGPNHPHENLKPEPLDKLYL
ncbi:MAG: 50S ribosomal protein L13 [Chlorobi bacterium]|nr:50S ribosomal protein L13 [Chlorobiota bacterium]